LSELGEVLYGRKQSTSEKSYTKSLLEAGPDKIGAKIREEAGELAEALKNETDERVLSEAADVIYHVMVGLTQRGLDWREVIEVLAKRTHRSGHAEKASR
jgi:phosphoribosyl-ATP pyrophosphohydrolase/phosphoribosyl-AMP cyclohydrolase